MSEENKPGIVVLHGKEYKTVALRISNFREKYPHWAIETEMLHYNDDEVIIKASILNAVGAVKATGIAHETKESSTINRTSFLENCETSAVGRALANLGMAGTEEFASAEEMSQAAVEQKINKVVTMQANHIRAAFVNYESVMAIKKGIATGDLSTAAEEWFTLGEEVKEHLWLSTKNGGCWSTQEREVMKSSEFRKAYFGEAA